MYKENDNNPGRGDLSPAWVSVMPGKLRRLSKLRRHMLRAAVICAVMAVCPAEVYGEPARQVAAEQLAVEQKPLGKRESREAADLICAAYKPWMRASLSGKLRMDGLPLSPTLKVSMERDKSIYLSVRAPFVGEVFRVDMTPGKVLIVNKMKKTYCELEYDDDHMILASAQSLLLGRVVIAGQGELSKKNYKECDFYSTAAESVEEIGDGAIADVADGWSVVPPAVSDAVVYGYSLDAPGRITGVVVDVDSRVVKKLAGVQDTASAAETAAYDRLLEIGISYDRNGDADVDMTAAFGKYRYSASLNMGKPDYGAKLMAPVELSPKYREVRLREVIKF